ncbi:MAG: LruC domain-containing protein [Bacteroidales bacterium]|nr:LruC domain-containing protein [Bacteroidales bacterium]
MSTNTWYHVAATYEYVADGSSKMNLYIDGSNVASTSFAVGPLQSNPQPFDVGRYYYSGGYKKYFHGYMDDFRVYSYARTGAQIASDMTTLPTGSESGLELAWLYEEGPDATVGVTATDETSNANDGTIEGCVYSDTTVPYTITDTDGDGVEDGEDDYPNDPDRAFDNYFPAAGYGSLAYEDLWPGKGDYDFNDVVVDYRFQTVTNASNEVVEIFAAFPVKASGATLENGFGFNLPDASSAFTGNPQKITVSGYDIQEGYISLNAYGHESGQTHPTIIVFDRIFNLLPSPGGELGVNTDPDGSFVNFDTVNITMIPDGVFSMANFSLTSWNPFIIVDMERGHEVHLPDYEPTDLMDISLLGQWEDDSDAGVGRYFKTESNLPWALDIPSEFEWPEEKKDITTAYLHFAEWAESGGVVYTDWYIDQNGYRNNDYIFQVP